MLEQNTFLSHLKIGHKLIRRQAPAAGTSSCNAGGLYKYPLAGDVVNSANEVPIAWDIHCLGADTKKIDIYIYAPSQANATIPFAAWKQIPASKQEYSAKLRPYWWVTDPTKSANVSLSLNIVPSGNQPWDSANPMGPTWVGEYIVPADGKIPDDAEKNFSLKERIIQVFSENGQLTAAGKTAAIVCPIVVVVVLLALLIRRLHIKRNNKTVDWAEQMDKRMSRISVDWTSGGDGSAGPVPGTRPASYMSRPSQDVNGRGNMAGRGAGVRVPRQIADVTPTFATDEEMREARPRGMSMYDEGNRTSRISFADNTRGDRVSRISYANSSEAHGRTASIPRVGQNGARHSQMQTDSYYDPDAPAVPQLDERYRTSHDSRRESRFSDGLVYADESDAQVDDDDDDDDDDEILMSPTQNDGPMPLGSGDVDRMRKSLDAGRKLGGGPSSGSPTRRDKSNTNEEEYDSQLRNSMLEYPALSMMSSGREESDGRDMFATMTSDRPVSAISDNSYIDHDHYKATGSGTGLTPDHPQYAGRSAGVSAQTGMAPPANFTSPDEAMKHYASLRANGPASPSMASETTTMRSLYTPDLANGHRTHASVAGSSLNEDDVVGYNEMIDHGHSR